MREDIKKILEIAVNAPSGSNSQPWSFEVKENKIYVIAMPEKDHPILNYKNRGTWIAHGALIENIVIASSFFGYEAKVIIFPDLNQPNLTAIIELSVGLSKADPLFSVIPSRSINRKRYENKLLTDIQKQELFNTISQFKDIELKFIENYEQRLVIGDALSINEVVTLENKKLHELFIKEIVWSKKEESEKKSGLYLKTMELQPPQQIVLKLLRNWNIMNFFNHLKFAHFIAKDNAKIYVSGAGIGVIVVKDKEEDFVSSGRALERLWLKATQMKLSFSIIAGTTFYWQAVQDSGKDIFSQEHIKIINESYNNMLRIFDVKKGVIALAFRVGFSPKPSAVSSKKTPKIKWIVKD